MTAEYQSHIEPNTTSGVRRTTAMEITKASVGPMDNNAYLLRCVATGDGLLVDAANEPERLVDLVHERLGNGILTTVVTTHQHYDHTQGLGMVIGVTGAQALAHPDDAIGLPIPSDPIQHGDSINVGDLKLSVIHLRGHTPGSVAVYYRDADGSGHLWTGDSLFPGGPGKTSSKENFDSLIRDLEERIFVLPDDTNVYPGHGDDTTLGAERPHLDEWRARGW